MKTLSTALAAFALVACSSEPNQEQDAPEPEAPATSSTIRAETVALDVSGMT